MAESKTRQKQCPYCCDMVDTRGLHLHVLKKSGNGHGGFDEIPDDFDPQSIKSVNKRPNNPISKSSSRSMTKHLYLCNWCNELCRGERGYKIHLTKKGEDGLHPAGASIEDEEYTLVPCDDDWNALMDLDDVYQIQQRRRHREEILKDK